MIMNVEALDEFITHITLLTICYNLRSLVSRSMNVHLILCTTVETCCMMYGNLLYDILDLVCLYTRQKIKGIRCTGEIVTACTFFYR